MFTDSADVWRARFLEQEASGLSAKAWCARNNLKSNVFYYWKNKLSHRDEPAVGNSWLPAILCDEAAADVKPSNCSIVIRLTNAEIEVRNDCNPDLLRCVISTLRRRSC